MGVDSSCPDVRYKIIVQKYLEVLIKKRKCIKKKPSQLRFLIKFIEPILPKSL